MPSCLRVYAMHHQGPEHCMATHLRHICPLSWGHHRGPRKEGEMKLKKLFTRKRRSWRSCWALRRPAAARAGKDRSGDPRAASTARGEGSGSESGGEGARPKRAISWRRTRPSTRYRATRREQRLPGTGEHDQQRPAGQDSTCRTGRSSDDRGAGRGPAGQPGLHGGAVHRRRLMPRSAAGKAAASQAPRARMRGMRRPWAQRPANVQPHYPSGADLTSVPATIRPSRSTTVQNTLSQVLCYEAEPHLKSHDDGGRAWPRAGA